MKTVLYLFLVLLFVLGLLIYFGKAIVRKLIQRKMQQLIKENVDLDNKNIFMDLDISKLKKMVNKIGEGHDFENDPNIQEEVAEMVRSFSNEFSNKFANISKQHSDNQKKQDLKQAEVYLDSMLKTLSDSISKKDEDFDKVLNRLDSKDKINK